MGCDGGTIPKRSELVRTAKRPEQKDKDMDREAKWSSCSISQQALTPPLVVCALGKLYSKESILEFLLDRSISASASHITGLKDVKELKMTMNPAFNKKAGLADQYYDTQISKYVCPVVGLEMNGKYKFCALWGCGCVLSERAIKEVETENCHSCGSKFENEDIVILYPQGDDLTLMENNMKIRREKMKAMRKEKKLKKTNKNKLDTEATNASTINGDVAGPSKLNGISTVSKKPNGDHVFEVPKLPSILKKVNEVDTSEIPTKLPISKKSNRDKEFDVSAKLPTVSKKRNGDNHFEVGGKLPKKDRKDRKDSGGSSSKSVDPKQSKIYKSLFTSGQEKRSSDSTAHWITYNPYHL